MHYPESCIEEAIAVLAIARVIRRRLVLRDKMGALSMPKAAIIVADESRDG